MIIKRDDFGIKKVRLSPEKTLSWELIFDISI